MVLGPFVIYASPFFFGFLALHYDWAAIGNFFLFFFFLFFFFSFSFYFSPSSFAIKTRGRGRRGTRCTCFVGERLVFRIGDVSI